MRTRREPAPPPGRAIGILPRTPQRKPIIGGYPPMSHVRQKNVAATRWSLNGEALGAIDLTEPSSFPYGENVFSVSVQRDRLPTDVFERLQQTMEQGLSLIHISEPTRPY